MNARGAGRVRRGFTLVELLVSLLVLSIIMLVTFGIINQTNGLWNRTRANINAFQAARAGFENMTRRISQATLNTYWDYEYPTDAAGNPDTSKAPRSYVRQSELHFISGKAQAGTEPNLLAGAELQTVTHAVFFQAPLGVSSSTAPAFKPANLLNARGFFVEFASDRLERPLFLRTLSDMRERHRFRLMEFGQATEQLSVYLWAQNPSAAERKRWFLDPLKADPGTRHVLAENIIALVLQPMRSPHEKVAAGDPVAELAPEFEYDSRRYVSASSTEALAKKTRNQFPPQVQVTMVAIDEAFAQRLDQTQPDPSLGLEKLFRAPTGGTGKAGEQYFEDLRTLEKTLVEKRANYRVFSTNVNIAQAKWSED